MGYNNKMSYPNQEVQAKTIHKLLTTKPPQHLRPEKARPRSETKEIQPINIPQIQSGLLNQVQQSLARFGV